MGPLATPPLFGLSLGVLRLDARSTGSPEDRSRRHSRRSTSSLRATVPSLAPDPDTAPPLGFDASKPDLGLGVVVDDLFAALRLLLTRAAQAWGGMPGFTVAGLLGLHGQLPGLPDRLATRVAAERRRTGRPARRPARCAAPMVAADPLRALGRRHPLCLARAGLAALAARRAPPRGAVARAPRAGSRPRGLGHLRRSLADLPRRRRPRPAHRVARAGRSARGLGHRRRAAPHRRAGRRDRALRRARAGALRRRVARLAGKPRRRRPVARAGHGRGRARRRRRSRSARARSCPTTPAGRSGGN